MTEEPISIRTDPMIETGRRICFLICLLGRLEAGETLSEGELDMIARLDDQMLEILRLFIQPEEDHDD